MLPAGTYYIGDLCYVMDNEWDDVCSKIIVDNTVVEGEFVLDDGRIFANFSTAHGDGVYSDNQDKNYAVDSGSIGCIKIDDIRNPNNEDIKRLGNIVTFDAPFNCHSNGKVITFGHKIAIDTDPPDDYDDYDPDSVYDDESGLDYYSGY
jgi:hypothetical protein